MYVFGRTVLGRYTAYHHEDNQVKKAFFENAETAKGAVAVHVRKTKHAVEQAAHPAADAAGTATCLHACAHMCVCM